MSISYYLFMSPFAIIMDNLRWTLLHKCFPPLDEYLKFNNNNAVTGSALLSPIEPIP